jgi:hypothetical protein
MFGFKSGWQDSNLRPSRHAGRDKHFHLKNKIDKKKPNNYVRL